jgi:hypothetical protein
MVIIFVNFYLDAKSTMSSHIIWAESQAAKMVVVLQCFGIVLFVIWQRLMWSLTPLAGRTITIISWVIKNNHSPAKKIKNNHSPWKFCTAYSKRCLLQSLSNRESPTFIWPIECYTRFQYWCLEHQGRRVTKCLFVNHPHPFYVCKRLVMPKNWSVRVGCHLRLDWP